MDMVQYTAASLGGRLAASANTGDADGGGLLESWGVHARNLADFLYPTPPDQRHRDDVIRRSPKMGHGWGKISG
jgi:hypothetical protein